MFAAKCEQFLITNHSITVQLSINNHSHQAKTRLSFQGLFMQNPCSTQHFISYNIPIFNPHCFFVALIIKIYF